MKRVYTQIRLPEDLHRGIKQLADQEDRSLNNMMVRLLTEGLDARRRQAEALAQQLVSQPTTGRWVEAPPPVKGNQDERQEEG